MLAKDGWQRGEDLGEHFQVGGLVVGGEIPFWEEHRQPLPGGEDDLVARRRDGPVPKGVCGKRLGPVNRQVLRRCVWQQRHPLGDDGRKPRLLFESPTQEGCLAGGTRRAEGVGGEQLRDAGACRRGEGGAAQPEHAQQLQLLDRPQLGKALGAAQRAQKGGVGLGEPSLELAELGELLDVEAGRERGVGEVELGELLEPRERGKVRDAGLPQGEQLEVLEARERREVGHQRSVEVERAQRGEPGERSKIAGRGLAQAQPPELLHSGQRREVLHPAPLEIEAAHAGHPGERREVRDLGRAQVERLQTGEPGEGSDLAQAGAGQVEELQAGQPAQRLELLHAGALEVEGAQRPEVLERREVLGAAAL